MQELSYPIKWQMLEERQLEPGTQLQPIRPISVEFNLPEEEAGPDKLVAVLGSVRLGFHPSVRLDDMRHILGGSLSLQIGAFNFRQNLSLLPFDGMFGALCGLNLSPSLVVERSAVVTFHPDALYTLLPDGNGVRMQFMLDFTICRHVPNPAE